MIDGGKLPVHWVHVGDVNCYTAKATDLVAAAYWRSAKQIMFVSNVLTTTANWLRSVRAPLAGTHDDHLLAG